MLPIEVFQALHQSPARESRQRCEMQGSSAGGVCHGPQRCSADTLQRAGEFALIHGTDFREGDPPSLATERVTSISASSAVPASLSRAERATFVRCVCEAEMPGGRDDIEGVRQRGWIHKLSPKTSLA